MARTLTSRPVLTATLAIGTLAAGTAAARYRAWHLRWGADDAEVGATLPGDEIPVSRGMHATRAVTIDAPPHAVWPWLVQCGLGKAGWYSYDLLDNLGRPSSWEVLPQWQHLAVGDPAAPMNPLIPLEDSAFRVGAFERDRYLLWVSSDTTWVWVLIPLAGGGTRLVTRIRAGCSGLQGMVFGALLEVADFPMMRKQLLGVRARAERLGGATTE